MGYGVGPMRYLRHSAAFVLLLSVSPGQEQTLLSRVQSAPQVSRAWDRAERAGNPTIRRSEFVRINTRALGRIQASGAVPLVSFRLDLFGKAHILDIDSVEDVLGYRVFVGAVRGHPGQTNLVVAPDGSTCHATIHMVDESYVLAFASHSDIHVLQDLEESRRPMQCGCCAPGGTAQYAPSLPTQGSGGTQRGPEALKDKIDVAMFYTPAAKAAAGSQAAIEAAMIVSIAQANSTCTNTKTPALFRLVHIAEVTYSDDGNSDLGRFRITNDGYMDNVHRKRDTYGADLMHLVTNKGAGYCGVAYLMTNNSTSFAPFAFGVTVRGCLSGNVVAHEMGHNIGCHHDHNNAGGAIYKHAYGYRTPDSLYRTVMAYSPGTRFDIWSSPKLSYGGYSTMGSAIEDNNLTITKTGATVAKFRANKLIDFRRIGGGIVGSLGNPRFTGTGILGSSTEPPTIRLWKYRPNTNGLFVIGLSPIKLPYFGGILVPSPDMVIPITGNGADIVIDARGLKNVTLPNIWVQALYLDAAAQQGVSATSGYRILL